MTKPIKLSFGSEATMTAISNIFIDEYMADAHGSYVKVYIYLLRCLGDSSMSFSVASISDKLDETEKDIIKAFKYWEKKKLLYISWDCDGQISSITVNPLTNQLPDDNIIPLASASTQRVESSTSAAVQPASGTAAQSASRTVAQPALRPAAVQSQANAEASAPVVTRPNYSARQLAQFRDFDDFNKLIDYIESRLGCVLKPTDLQTPAFLFEQLEMSTDLIRFLYDYCLFKDKKTPAYIEKVAMSWKEKDIDSVEKARAEVFSRSKECAAVKAAFGINRAFGAVELEFIDRWRFTYNMDAELIREACNRALLNTGKPDYKYAESILEGWFRNNVHSKEDVARLDEAHTAKAQKSTAAKKQNSAPSGSGNKFNDFQTRTYSSADYDDLETRKLSGN